MSFKTHFALQLKMHPSMKFQDVIKLCYQASFGAEHLLLDKERAKAYLISEFSSVEPTDEPLFERVSDDVCRANLGAWKKKNLPIEELFEAFVSSVSVKDEPKRAFFKYLSIAEGVMKENMHDFSVEEWHNFLDLYLENGVCAVHHSAEYREAEKPSYRIIKVENIKEEWS